MNKMTTIDVDEMSWFQFELKRIKENIDDGKKQTKNQKIEELINNFLEENYELKDIEQEKTIKKAIVLTPETLSKLKTFKAQQKKINNKITFKKIINNIITNYVKDC